MRYTLRMSVAPVRVPVATAAPCRWMLVLSVASLLLTVLLWSIGAYVAEYRWLTTILAYTPPFVLAISTGLVCLLTLFFRERRLIIINGIAFLFVWFIVLGFRIPSPLSPADNAPRLRVFTLNIAHGSGGVKKVIAAIQQAYPDVFCLQESNEFYGCPDPLPEIIKGLPSYRFMRAGETALATRLPITGVMVYPFVGTDGYRAIVEMEVRVKDRKARILTAHLTTPLHPQLLTREEFHLRGHLRIVNYLRFIEVEKILSAAKRTTDPVIVCGDFNTPANGVFYRRLTATMTDAFTAKGFGFGYTFPANAPVFAIDHILTGQGAVPVSAYVPVVNASDHRPIVADIALLEMPAPLAEPTGKDSAFR